MGKKSQTISKKRDSFAILLVALIASLTTLWFQTKSQDPFNLPKFSLLICLSPFCLYFIFTNYQNKIILTNRKIGLSALGFFLIIFLINSLLSNNIYQAMIGVYQRNLGFLTYFCFAILFITIAQNLTFSSSRLLLIIFIVMGGLEATYGVIQYLGADPVNWKNSYSPILGTFGNPNFQSAFLGVTASSALSLVISAKNILKVLLLLQAITSLFLIQVSNSSQGFLSFGVVSTFIILNYLRNHQRKLLIPGLISAFTTFFIALLGILNSGPASFLYQSSISARGDYWRAAIAMMRSDPLTGIGIERYGEQFSSFRDLQQVRERSYATYSDNAHNIFLHLGATGGLPLLMSYLVLMLFVVIIGIFKLRQLSEVNGQDLSTLLGVLVAFLAISFISPENIGFTIWGWVFAGAVFALSTNIEEAKTLSSPEKRGFDSSRVLVIVLILILLLPSLFLSTSASRADRGIWNTYATAYSGSGTLEELLNQMKKVTEIVPSEQRYKLLAASISIGLNQFRLSRDYSDQVLKINPLSIDAYRIKAISFEKELNLRQANIMRENWLKFDPYNLENLDKLVRNYAEIGDRSNSQKYFTIMKGIQPTNSLVLALTEFIKN